MVAYAGENDPEAAIEWSSPIEMLEVFSPAFRTRDGIRVGALVDDVVRILGAVTEILVSEVEARQFIRFAHQPDGITFRLDYTGVFPPGESRTQQYQPGAMIYSIAISPPPQ